MIRKFSSARSKRIYIPPRVSRIEGDFPVFRSDNRIIDISQIANDDEPSGKYSRSTKPHLAKSVETSESSSGANMTSLDPRRLRSLRKKGVVEGKSPLKDFDAEKDVPATSLNERLKMKKFRWMPNPFLSNNDVRQGGPLYYAKYFQDRDRRLDEKLVREEVQKQSDKLVKSEETSEGLDSSESRQRRKRAIWRNYRPIKETEIEKIGNLSKLASVLVNEIHLLEVSASEDRVWIFPKLEDQLGEIIGSGSFKADRKSIAELVKCVYHFGVYGKLNPIILNKCLETVVEEVKRLKPENLIYLLEALRRLRFRDQRCLNIIESLELCWPVVRKTPHMLIKAANAVCRLDLYSPKCSELTLSLGDALPSFTRKQLEKIKAITICTMFDDVMTLDFLVLSHRANVEYVRHLLIAYLKIRSRADLVSKIPASTIEWIETHVEKEAVRKQLQRSGPESCSMSSPLHVDIERIVQKLGIKSVAMTDCGPFTFDIFLSSTNTVIEACGDFQFYARTAKLTSDARLRHELIRGLGFKLVPVSPFQWNNLKTDAEKASFLSRQLGTVS